MMGAGSWPFDEFGKSRERLPARTGPNVGQLPSRRAPNALAAAPGGGPTRMAREKKKGVKPVVSRPPEVGCMMPDRVQALITALLCRT
jgi:hypothetical protein